MINMNKTALMLGGAVIAIVVGSLTSSSPATPAVTASPLPLPPPPQPQGVDRAFQARNTFLAWADQELDVILDAGGMEMGTAGFHICKPSGTPNDSNAYSSSLFTTPGHSFWYADCLPGSKYPANSFDLSISSGTVTPVAMGRAFNSGLLTTAFTAIETDGTQSSASVFVAFDLGAISRLQGIVGAVDNYAQYKDWYYVWREAGEPQTPFYVALVGDNLALEPFSVTDLIASSNPTVPIRVASGLDPVFAQDLVSRLGF